MGYIVDTPNKKKVREEGNRPQWSWITTDQQAATLLRLVLPELKIKYSEAKLALEFQEVKNNTKHGYQNKISSEDFEIREQYKQKLSFLKTVPSSSNASRIIPLNSVDACDGYAEPSESAGVETERGASQEEGATVRSACN